MEYGSTSYTRYEGPPADFFAVEGVEQWCPECFDGALSEEQLAELATYLGIMKQYYASDRFRLLDQGAAAPSGLRPRSRA